MQSAVRVKYKKSLLLLLVANPCCAREPTCLCGRLKNNYIKSKIDYEIIPFHEFLLFQFNFCYNLINKSLFECAISCEKSTNWFQILKFLKDQKIYIYDYTIEKYKRKIGYLQKNI